MWNCGPHIQSGWLSLLCFHRWICEMIKVCAIFKHCLCSSRFTTAGESCAVHFLKSVSNLRFDRSWNHYAGIRAAEALFISESTFILPTADKIKDEDQFEIIYAMVALLRKTVNARETFGYCDRNDWSTDPLIQNTLIQWWTSMIHYNRQASIITYKLHLYFENSMVSLKKQQRYLPPSLKKISSLDFRKKKENRHRSCHVHDAVTSSHSTVCWVNLLLLLWWC